LPIIPYDFLRISFIVEMRLFGYFYSRLAYSIAYIPNILQLQPAIKY